MYADKIITLLTGTKDSQNQAINLMLALEDPSLIKDIRQRLNGFVSINKDRQITLHNDIQDIELENQTLKDLIHSNLLRNGDVKHAYLEDVSFAELEEYIGLYPELETLKIKSSKCYWSWTTPVLLDTLPESIGSLRCLKFLYIEHQYDLTTLPSSMSQLTQLEKVSFARTGLSSLPAWLMNCPNLTVLNINGMHNLKAIHPALMKHPALKKIHSNHNGTRYLGSLRPVLPNDPLTLKKYSRMHNGSRLSLHSARWRQEQYLFKS